MQIPTIKLSNELRQNNPEVSQRFEKNFALIGKQFRGHESSKTTAIYTHIANAALAKIKSPFDRFFVDNTNDINMLQK